MIAVDASVCLKWIFAEQYSEQAVALAEHAQQTHQRLIAPPLLLIEVTNVIRQRMRSEGLSLEDAENALARFLAFGVSIRPATPAGQAALQQSALWLAAEYDLPAVYDAQNLALAKRRGPLGATTFPCQLVIMTDRTTRITNAQPNWKMSRNTSMTLASSTDRASI